MARNLVLLLLLICTFAAAQTIDMEAVLAAEDFRWGLRAFHAGNFEDSILSLEKSLSRKPQDPRTRYWLASALYRAGFEDAALAEWRYLLDQDPTNTAVDNTVDVLTYRRGLGEQLEERSPYVVGATIDAGDERTYPMRRPSSVWIREDGSLYVVAFASNEVLLMDINNRVQRVLRGGMPGFDRPYDCLEAVDPGSGMRYLFVAEYGRNQILKLDLQGERLLTIGSTGSGPGQLLGPQYLAADGSGYLYVSDWGNGRVSKYDFQGNFLFSVGSAAEFRLRGPTGIACRDQMLYVADGRAGRIHVYDQSGNGLDSFGEGVLVQPEGIAFLDEEHLLVIDGQRLLEYNTFRETWDTLIDLGSAAGRLTHLSVSPNGEIYVVDFDENKIHILSEMSALYTSLYVQVDRVNSMRFPEIQVEVSVQDRGGRPIIGLQAENFIFSEFFTEIPSVELVRAPGDPSPLQIALIVEKSPSMRAYLPDLEEAVQTLHGQLEGASRPGRWQVLSAGNQTVIETEVGASRLLSVQAAQKGPWDPRWRLDRALRLGAAELIPQTARRAVVLLTTGTLHRESFSDFSLAEVTDFLQNNSIPLYVVHFDAQADRALEYICERTGGSVLHYYAPRGLNALVAEMGAGPAPRYFLQLRSVTESGFGKNYIDLQAEVFFHRKSGRAQSGYFAPLSE